MLDSTADRFAGVASGVNNAVARAAGLLAVAVVPAVAGITGEGYTDPVVLRSGFRIVLLIGATLLVTAAAVAVTLRRPAGDPATVSAGRVPVETFAHCGVSGPPVHPSGNARLARR